MTQLSKALISIGTVLAIAAVFIRFVQGNPPLAYDVAVVSAGLTSVGVARWRLM